MNGFSFRAEGAPVATEKYPYIVYWDKTPADYIVNSVLRPYAHGTVLMSRREFNDLLLLSQGLPCDNLPEKRVMKREDFTLSPIFASNRRIESYE